MAVWRYTANLLALALLIGSSPAIAYGGSIRYELPALLGEHRYDGALSFFNAIQEIETPFGFHEIEEARLVVAGTVSNGQVRGDGIIREETSFELLPSVNARPSFANTIDISTEPTPGVFHFETPYPDPFTPTVTPLPKPSGFPPITFWVYLGVSPALGTQFPSLIERTGDVLSSGIIVDVPIVAEINQAYIVLSGASILPEPGSLALACGALALIVAARFRAARRALFAAAALLLLGRPCQAGFTFLPLSPYLSAADSPFPVLTDPTFHLEDFEDENCVPGPGVFCGGGKFDAPGVNLIHGSTGPGASVDADDGTIDGSGATGASGTSVTIFANPDLTFTFDAIEFEFDQSELGFFPTAVGFVLTSGAGERSGLTVYDANGNSVDFDTTNLLLDPSTTSDDRFIAIINPIGISRLQMGRTIITATGDFNTPRVDHLQYGLFIPEPSTKELVLLAALLGVRVARTGQRNSKGSAISCFGVTQKTHIGKQLSRKRRFRLRGLRIAGY